MSDPDYDCDDCSSADQCPYHRGWSEAFAHLSSLPEPTSGAEDAYTFINDIIVPMTIRHFKSKQKDYSGGPAFMLLGVRGQFSDLNRKFWKLYRALWEGESLEGEQPEEILMDFVGHCFLTLYCLRAERTNGERDQA